VMIIIERRDVLSRLSICSSGGLEEIVRMYKSRHFHHPKFLTVNLFAVVHTGLHAERWICCSGEHHDGSPSKSGGRGEFTTHSSSSSDIDSNDEVLPWLLFLLLDPPPDEPVTGDRLVF
jgi:hypothetical protein